MCPRCGWFKTLVYVGEMMQGVNKQICHGTVAGGATSMHLAQYFAQRTLLAATVATTFISHMISDTLVN